MSKFKPETVQKVTDSIYSLSCRDYSYARKKLQDKISFRQCKVLKLFFNSSYFRKVRTKLFNLSFNLYCLWKCILFCHF